MTRTWFHSFQRWTRRHTDMHTRQVLKHCSALLLSPVSGCLNSGGRTLHSPDCSRSDTWPTALVWELKLVPVLLPPEVHSSTLNTFGSGTWSFRCGPPGVKLEHKSVHSLKRVTMRTDYNLFRSKFGLLVWFFISCLIDFEMSDTFGAGLQPCRGMNLETVLASIEALQKLGSFQFQLTEQFEIGSHFPSLIISVFNRHQELILTWWRLE